MRTRRYWIRWPRRVLPVLAALYAGAVLVAMPQAWAEGAAVRDANSVVSPDAPVVLFMWYGCAACSELQQFLSSRPEAANWQYLPLTLRPFWRVQSKTMLVLSKMHIPAEINLQLMNAYHGGELKAGDLGALMPWLTRHGVDPGVFADAYHARTTNRAMVQLDVLQQRLGIEHVPAAWVNRQTVLRLADYATIAEFVTAIERVQANLAATTIKKQQR